MRTVFKTTVGIMIFAYLYAAFILLGTILHAIGYGNLHDIVTSGGIAYMISRFTVSLLKGKKKSEKTDIISNVND